MPIFSGICSVECNKNMRTMIRKVLHHRRIGSSTCRGSQKCQCGVQIRWHRSGYPSIQGLIPAEPFNQPEDPPHSSGVGSSREALRAEVRFHGQEMDNGEAVLETGKHFSAFPAFEIDEMCHSINTKVRRTCQ